MVAKPRAVATVVALPARAPGDYVRMPEVKQRSGLSRPTIYRKIADGTFPRQVPLSVNCVAWTERDLAAWLADPMGWKEAT